MKIKHLIPIFSLFLLFEGCQKEPIQVISELPNNIDTLKPVENLVDSLMLMLPPGENALLGYPLLFSDTIQKNIVLTKESKVYVTFIDEGALNKNSLCWYSYNQSQPPLKVNDIKSSVLFPNISKKGEGGLLEPGYTLQLGTGTFPAGTVIGFLLVVDGWKDGNIDYSNPTFYTNYTFNPEEKQQHILFKNEYSHYLVVGFEDMLQSTSDLDFNDVLFAVQDNNEGYEATSFDLSKVVVK